MDSSTSALLHLKLKKIFKNIKSLDLYNKLYDSAKNFDYLNYLKYENKKFPKYRKKIIKNYKKFYRDATAPL